MSSQNRSNKYYPSESYNGPDTLRNTAIVYKGRAPTQIYNTRTVRKKRTLKQFRHCYRLRQSRPSSGSAGQPWSGWSAAGKYRQRRSENSFGFQNAEFTSTCVTQGWT